MSGKYSHIPPLREFWNPSVKFTGYALSQTTLYSGFIFIGDQESIMK